MRRLGDHPDLEDVLKRAGEELGVVGDLLFQAVKHGAPVAALLRSTFHSVDQPSKSAGAGKKDGKDGRAYTELGERKNAPKILNAEERLAELARLEGEKQQEAADGAVKAATISRVNQILLLDGIIDDAAFRLSKRPIKAHLKAFIHQKPGALDAWRVYTGKHGVGSGDTIAWKYFFDFVHGGYVQHQTIKEGQAALPLVTDDQDGAQNTATTARAPYSAPGEGAAGGEGDVAASQAATGGVIQI